MYWRIEFVFVWSTSNYHHVNPPVSAVVKCKMVDLYYYGLKVKMPLWPFSEHCFYATYSQHPRCWSLLCLQWQSMVSVGYSWCGPRMWTQSSYLMANPYLSVKWELSNSPWNLHLRYRLPIAQSWRLTESVKLCVLQGRTDDYSSWLLGQCWIQYHCQELMYIINQEKTPLQMTSQLQCCHFLYIGYIGLFYRIFAFSDCILMCVLFVMTALQSRSCLMLYLWSVLECYQYSLWRYIKLVNLNLNLFISVSRVAVGGSPPARLLHYSDVTWAHGVSNHR